MNQPQNPAEHLHHWPTLPSFLLPTCSIPSRGQTSSASLGSSWQHSQPPLAPPHPAVGHSCPPPPLCTVGHRMFLRSFVRLQGLRSWHAAASDEWKVSAVLLLQTKKWWTTCYGSTSPRHPSSEAGVTDPSHGTAGRMLGSANEGNRYRNANNYQCLQQLPKSSSAARAGWGGGTRCTPSSWFLQ